MQVVFLYVCYDFMSSASAARSPQTLSSGRKHSIVNDPSQMVRFLLVLLLVLAFPLERLAEVFMMATISHSSAQISRKPRVAEVTRHVAEDTRRVHEMGGVGSNPSELGFPLHVYEVPESIPAAPLAFLGHPVLCTVIPSTG